MPASSSSVSVPITSVRREDFLCSYKTHCFPTCVCCDFYACDCRMHCPKGCSCLHDSAWSTNVIQCSAGRHADVPLLIPMDATHIHLDGNNLGDVDSQSFIGRRRVTELFLNNSRVSSLSRQTLSGLSSLRVLHLEDNQIKEIHGHEFTSLVSLRELYLQNNELVRIAPSAFDSLTSLAVLRLDGNLLTTYPAWHLSTLGPRLRTLTLSKNLWSCACDFLAPFAQFVAANRRIISDAGDLACMGENLSERRLDLLTAPMGEVDCSEVNEIPALDQEDEQKRGGRKALVQLTNEGEGGDTITQVCIFNLSFFWKHKYN